MAVRSILAVLGLLWSGAFAAAVVVLVFTGGVTSSIGHDGDSSGSRAVWSRSRDSLAGPPQSLVFGCPLTEAQAEMLGEAQAWRS